MDLFSESIVSEIYFELASILKNLSLNFQGCTVSGLQLYSFSLQRSRTFLVDSKFIFDSSYQACQPLGILFYIIYYRLRKI